MFVGKHVLITGGTGSYGKKLLERLFALNDVPESISVFSRDEEKQYRLAHKHESSRLKFIVGDIRDADSVANALRGIDIVFNAAAMKQVPTCEYAPHQAVLTNILGAENVVSAIARYGLPVETVIGISTDKACKPVNVMGMTKALQERIFIQGNLRAPRTRFVCVRYGNVLASRGSVVPLFLHLASQGKPLTVTDPSMTRFLLTLDQAVDTSLQALKAGRPGDVVVPCADAGSIGDIAQIMARHGGVEVRTIGIRPGEKKHEIMVSEEEVPRARRVDRWFHLRPMLSPLDEPAPGDEPTSLQGEYSSEHAVVPPEALEATLQGAGLLPERVGSGQ